MNQTGEFKAVWKVECADGISFEVVGRDDAEDRFWDAIRRSAIDGVWKLVQPDGATALTVMCYGPQRLSPWTYNRMRRERDMDMANERLEKLALDSQQEQVQVDVPANTNFDAPPKKTTQLERRCILCGAEPGQPCRVLGDRSTDPSREPDTRLRGVKKGDERPMPHFYR